MINWLALLYLLLSCAILHSLHTYLLVSQRSDRKLTISDHAVATNKVHQFYVVGHVVGITFYGLFGYVFYRPLGLSYLFYLTAMVCLLDMIQAILPAKGRTSFPHLVIAYSMGILALVTVTIATLKVEQITAVKIFNLTTLVSIYLILIKTIFIRKKVYVDQVIMTILIDIVLVLTLLAAKR